MITKDNPDFFSILAGKNAVFYEKLLMTYFNEIYRGTMGEIISNKEYMKTVILKVLREINYEDETKNFSLILNRLEEAGWIESKYDNALMEYIYNFTRTGRKMAQSIYQLNNKSAVTRHRNVRSTLGLLESYKRDSDPYDLVDALEASDYIVSDLMDITNEITEARKQMIKDATCSLNSAGENFLEFLETDFSSSIVVYFQEDSISQNAIRINKIINDILEDTKRLETKNARMIKRYPHLKIEDYPVETQLQTISNRVRSAKDNKMPELINAISSLFSFSEMVLKQVSSLMVKRSSHLNSLALEILNADTTKKEKILKSFSNKISISKVRHFDPYKIKIKTSNKKRVKNNTVAEDVAPTKEQLREQKIKEAIRESRGYIAKDVQERIKKTLADEDSFTNTFVPIENYKDLSFSLNLVPVAKKSGLYNVVPTNRRSTTKYFTTDEYTISKKED